MLKPGNAAVMLWVSNGVCGCISALDKSENVNRIDNIEDRINSCLSDIRGDTSDVVDVIRKALASDDDDNRFVSVWQH